MQASDEVEAIDTANFSVHVMRSVSLVFPWYQHPPESTHKRNKTSWIVLFLILRQTF